MSRGSRIEQFVVQGVGITGGQESKGEGSSIQEVQNPLGLESRGFEVQRGGCPGGQGFKKLSVQNVWSPRGLESRGLESNEFGVQEVRSLGVSGIQGVCSPSGLAFEGSGAQWF